MRFAKSAKLKYEEDQQRIKSLKDPYLKFVWLPAKTNYGVWAWLEEVWVDHGVRHSKWDDHWSMDDSPTYHLKEDLQ